MACDRTLTLGARGVCRLCHKHASHDREPGRSLDVIGANSHGQQLFFVDAGIRRRSISTTSTNVSADADADGATQPAIPKQQAEPQWLRNCDQQLALFTMTPHLAGHGRAGLHQRAHPDDVAPLEAIAHQIADAGQWSRRQRNEAILGTRIMLGIQTDGRAPVRASEVEALSDIDMCVWTVLEVLSAAGALIEDRVPTIDAWFVERITGLPGPMVTELETWFDIMKNGTRIPPRRRPRSHQTITLHLTWALPIVRQWAAAGHTSLREITKEHVLDALPAAGAERSRAGQGLKSILRLLKARKVLFLDPTARIKTGEHPSNQPLPLDPDHIQHVRELLFSDNPATAVVVALIAFHGIRMGQLQRIELTHIVDGRLAVDGRGIPLAEPVRERIATWLDHRATRWPATTNGYLFINKHSNRRNQPVDTMWLRRCIGTTVTPRQLREDRILAEAHATAGDVKAIAYLFGLSINASNRYAYSLEHDDLVASSPTHNAT